MKFNRRQFVQGTVLATAGAATVLTVADEAPQPDFAKVLDRAGIREAAREIGMNADEVFGPLVERSNHPYRSYRWSVSYAETGGPLIQALPPEEEMGWTPWEEWLALDGQPLRRAMVLFPLEKTTRGVPLWWCLESSRTELQPRRAQPPKTLADLFRRDRVIEAAKVTGFDAEKLLLKPMTPEAEAIYLQMRWSVAPHRLAADLPVIQCLPSRERAHEWPWETWYTDGKTPLIHHVHFSAPNSRTESKPWSEGVGAPQRPVELFGTQWHWYDDPKMTPALAT